MNSTIMKTKLSIIYIKAILDTDLILSCYRGIGGSRLIRARQDFVLNFGWPLNRGKDNRKTLNEMTKR